MAVGLKGTNPGEILQAIEDKLIAMEIVPTADAIYWVKDGDEFPEKPTGKRDILLCVTQQAPDQGSQRGGGRMGFRFTLLIDVRLRTSVQLDRVNTAKDALKAHWIEENTILNALLRFFPTDTGDDTGNALTIEGLNLDWDTPPHPDRMTPKWGVSIGRYRCHYLPALTTTVIG